MANNIAKSIIVDNDNIYVSGVSEINGIIQNTSVKYSSKIKPITLTTGINGNKYVKNELLIRFDTSVINKNIIDKTDITSGVLSDFISSNALNELGNKTGFSWHKLDSYKIFLRMTTADSISLNRLGDTIKTKPFWATISVYIPSDNNEQIIADSISDLPFIIYAEKDYFSELHSIPDDILYQNEQTSLFNPTHGINVQQAWNKQVGQTYTKVGVYDSGINWRHEDFGNGTSSGTKVVGGWDFYDNASPFNQTSPDEDGHGTATSGIIGALRNNNKGIAGVVGGDVQNGNTGAQLFSMAIPVDVALNPYEVVYTLHSLAGPAIIEGAMYNPNTGYGYGLNIQNHSWGHPSTSITLKDAVENCYLNNCIFVVSSGNDHNTTINYPATYNDEWVIKVGANDASGSRANFSTYGNNLDVIAPGTNDIYSSLDHNNNSSYTYNGNGTSFSAPMVAGVSALLYSEHNTNNGYPNNLSPEDVEVFLQSFATDIQSTGVGYDQQTGYGRVNAELSLSKVSLPEFFVKHSGGQASPLQTTATGLNVVVSNSTNGVPAGTYNADRYQVTYTFIDIFSPSETVLSHWPRLSSSIGVSAANPISGDTWFTYTPTINQNVASVTTTTFCWYINTNSIGQSINKWIPAPPSQLKTAYSLYVRDTNPSASINDQGAVNNFSLFPNPTNNEITINYNLLKNSNTELYVYDAIGKKVAKHNIENQTIGQHSMTINLSHLSDGLYFCNLKVGDQLITKKILKK